MNRDSDNRTARKRAEELLSQMTLKEKVGQLTQKLYGFRIFERQGDEITLTDEFKKEVETYGGLGTLYGLYRADPWSGKDYENGLYGELAVKAYNLVQDYVLQHSRLKIPVLSSSECPHGHQALEGYLLPVNLCMGASFHPDLIHQAYHVCGKQLKEMGVNFALISLVDVVRDPRWGRSEECFSEDPYLCSRMAEQVVNAVQQEGVSVVAKHFAAQGESTGGVNASAARIGERELREIHLPAMKACCDAGVDGVMAAYNEIDGIYCHMNRHLLTDILREEMGFHGVVMADGCAIDQLDKTTGDNVRSAGAALHAGVDVGLWDEAFGRLDEALENGYISEEELDEAVLRVLELKFSQGLFENPYLDTEKDLTDFNTEEYPQALNIARESVVLLENRNQALPLSKEMGKIAVIGPNADSIYNMLGDYTPPVDEKKGTTVLEGIRSCVQNTQCSVLYAKGCSTTEGTEVDRKEAVRLSEEADVTVLVLGGTSSRFGEETLTFDSNGAAVASGKISMDCGEGVDASCVELPKVQRELAEEILCLSAKSGKKVITVIIGGRPYAPGITAEKSDALLYAFYPGIQGGKAIGEILFGDVNPSGRLPVSVPRHTGQVPVYYNYKNSYAAMHYYDEQDGPAYSFGAGKGYSSFSYENVSVNQNEMSVQELKEKTVCVNADIRNIGKQDGYAVPLLYISGLQGSTVRRIRELKAFDKVWIPAGESKTVKLSLPYEAFAIWNQDMKFETEPGEVKLALEEMGETVWSSTVKFTR